MKRAVAWFGLTLYVAAVVAKGCGCIGISRGWFLLPIAAFVAVGAILLLSIWRFSSEGK